MWKTLFKSVISVVICSLALSCSMITDSYGDIVFKLPNIDNYETYLESREILKRNNTNDNSFIVTLRKKNGPIVKKEELPPNSSVYFHKIKNGYYIISLSYEDDNLIAEGSSELYVFAGRNNLVDIDISYIEKTPHPDINDESDTQTPEIPNTDNGESNTSPSPDTDNDKDSNTKPDIEHPNIKPEENSPSKPNEIIPEPNSPIERITYYVDGTKGDDSKFDGTSIDSPLRTVSNAISKMSEGENYIVEVKGTIAEKNLINVNKNINLIIRGASDGTSKIIKSSGSDFLVVGTSNGKAINDNQKLVRPTVKLENVTIQADTTKRALLVYYGTLQLGDGVIVKGSASTSVQLHVGDGSLLYIGGSLNLSKPINMVGSACVTIDKPLVQTTSPIILNLYKYDGKTPNYDTKRKVLKSEGDVVLIDEISKIQLGNKNYTFDDNGMIIRKK